MIINAHSHFSTTPDVSFFYPEFTLSQLINDMDKNDIQFAITCLNPKLLSLLCPHDCSTTCPVYGKHNHLNHCGNHCKNADIHWMKIFDSTPGYLRAQCIICNNIIFDGADPCHDYNIEFLRQCANYKERIFPLLYLHLANSSLDEEVTFFEKNYQGKFVGYKFHPQTDMRCLDDIEHFNSSLPILIHTGLRDVDNSHSAFNFAKRYNGNVILAHACRLNIEVLDMLKNYPNIFIDISPACTLFTSKEFTIDGSALPAIKQSQDIYKIVFEHVPIDRILFGSDVPWGDTLNELELVLSLGLSENEKQKILFKNAVKAYKLPL